MQNSVFVILRNLKKFVRTDLGTALAIAIVWEIILTTIGYVLSGSPGKSPGLFDHTMRWDAGWYLAIINGHYSHITASAAFYPLFPFLVYIVHFLSFGVIDYSISAQLINTAAVWLALTAAIKIARILIGNTNRLWIVALLLSAPAAFFMHAFYSEALFIALSFWAYYFALKKQWLHTGILLGILTATRLPSILIIALCSLEYLRSYDWNIRKALNKNALYFLISPAGFIAFGLYLTYAQNDFLGMFHAYKATTDWNYQIFNPNILETILKVGYQIVRAVFGIRPIDSDFIVNILLPACSLLLLSLGSLYLTIKHRSQLLPLGIVGFLSIMMFTINSNVVSVHRYVLPSLTIYIAIALFIKKKPVYIYIVCGIGILAQLFLYSNFVQGVFAG